MYLQIIYGPVGIMIHLRKQVGKFPRNSPVSQRHGARAASAEGLVLLLCLALAPNCKKGFRVGRSSL